MNSISATLMPLLPSRYNAKNGHISEAEINASLKTDNWAALSLNPPTLALYKEIPIVIMYIVQELCESRGGRPGLSVLTSLLVSVDVKNY